MQRPRGPGGNWWARGRRWARGHWRPGGQRWSRERRGSWEAAIALAVGYACGAVPVAGRVGRAAGVDVYREGEANPGATNAWRLAGPGAGLAVLAGDMAKGALPVLVARRVFPADRAAGAGRPAGRTIGPTPARWATWAAGVGAILGHGFPPGGRRGGRSVATLAGVLAALAPVPAAAAAAVTLAILPLRGREAAITAGLVAYPIAHGTLRRDLPELAAVGALEAGVALRWAATRQRDPVRTADPAS